MRFQPQGHAAQLHGQRVFVHAVEAAGHHVADGLADVIGIRLVFAGTDFGQFLAQPPRRRQQEMSRTAGGVKDAEGEQGVFGEGLGEW
ncbi:hypothetical protein Cabther_B0714 [Chloracidobacterium thermophilum B]|uniref:Uncharacterized protein n=1 Tax=Chloracidobacterium thermophilum (strain B) TaxID=981222 RepID=G2LL36_CHLTF|nr:hypothetical protein Cabther_B0714 [Chloracidobacterium thermophilum B]